MEKVEFCIEVDRARWKDREREREKAKKNVENRIDVHFFFELSLYICHHLMRGCKSKKKKEKKWNENDFLADFQVFAIPKAVAAQCWVSGLLHFG